MPNPDALAAIAPLVAELEKLGVMYYLGGSLASSFYGKPRTTIDADLVADLALKHLVPLVESLQPQYYISEAAVRNAISRKSCFNTIHLATMFKVDVFAVKDRAYDRAALARIHQDSIDADRPEVRLAVASPEDTVLNKLEWFRLGGEVSERQWLDVIGVLRVQQGALEEAYLDHWAAALGVADLLDRARKESQ